MENLLENILFATALCDIVFAVNMLLGERRKLRSNKLFAAYAMAGAIWSFCFATLITQENEETAYLLRCIGMFGVFMSLILLAILILGWVDIKQSVKSIIKIFAMSFLMLKLFDACGWAGDGNMAAMRELYEHVDVIHAKGYRKDGRYQAELSAEAQRLVRQYHQFEYYRMNGAVR